eukprot:751231-Hanusia_phi.AAC.13
MDGLASHSPARNGLVRLADDPDLELHARALAQQPLHVVCNFLHVSCGIVSGSGSSFLSHRRVGAV